MSCNVVVKVDNTPNEVFLDEAWEAARNLAVGAVVLPHGETITKACDYSLFERELTRNALELQFLPATYDELLLRHRQLHTK